MKVTNSKDNSLLVDISDALSERDRVRFTVHTRTKLPQFSKPVLSVVRQHEEFIWLHDCLADNDQYAGHIIPPPPPKPDFDSSREKLQRLGDSESQLTKDEFSKMKQELEAEYLAIFKKTVAMHEIFLQRLAAHEKFREDSNFKIFLEYENELAVRGKSKREKLAGSIQNIGRSLTDFVITTSQVANTHSLSLSSGGATSNNTSINNNTRSGLVTSSDNNGNVFNNNNASATTSDTVNGNNNIETNSNARKLQPDNSADNNHSNVPFSATSTASISSNQLNHSLATENGNDNDVDEQYFEKERLFLALYYNSIRETAIQADRVTQAHKCVADSYLHIAQQLVRLAAIEVLPVTSSTKDPSRFLSCPMPSLVLPSNRGSDAALSSSATSRSGALIEKQPQPRPNNIGPSTSTSTLSSNTQHLELVIDTRELGDDEDRGLGIQIVDDSESGRLAGDKYNPQNGDNKKNLSNNHAGTALDDILNSIDPTSEGLKRLLMNMSDYFEQARKVEGRIASDEDLKLTDTLLYYKRDTVAAQELLMRRLRFLNEFETATKSLDKARQKGSRTAMQYAEVIQKQARENFVSISKLAKQELIEYKQRRVASFERSFTDLAELELKHLRTNSQLIINCLNICRGLTHPTQMSSQQQSSASQKTPSGSASVGVSVTPSTSTGIKEESDGGSSKQLATSEAMVDVPLVGSAKVIRDEAETVASTSTPANIGIASIDQTAATLPKVTPPPPRTSTKLAPEVNDTKSMSTTDATISALDRPTTESAFTTAPTNTLSSSSEPNLTPPHEGSS